jgi:hypothetical protein
MGPFWESDLGNKWILVMIDYLMKWPVVVALLDKWAETVVRAFVEQLVCNHGALECLLSDQGCEFLNEVLISVNADLCVHCLKMLVYHLQTDGLTECFNSTLQNMLSMYVTEHQRDWDTYIPYVLVVYWCSVNKATLEMPFYLMYGQDHYLPINVSLGLPQAQSEEDVGDYQSGLMERLMQAFQVAKEHQLEAQERNCCSYNCDRTDKPFSLGEKVWLHVPSVRKEHSKKFTQPWQGPYQVVKIQGGLNYGLVNTHNPHDHQFAHVSRLKKWIGPMVDDSGSSNVLRTATRSVSGGGSDEHVEVDEILNN